MKAIVNMLNLFIKTKTKKKMVNASSCKAIHISGHNQVIEDNLYYSIRKNAENRV